MEQDVKVSSEPQGRLYAVYGTLRRGFGNFRALMDNEHCEFLGEYRTQPLFKMVSMGGFPGVIMDSEDKHAITVEVFRVKHPGVERSVDGLEGYPGWYDKQLIDTPYGQAFIYTQTNAAVGSRPFVESGDWKQFVEERRKVNGW